LLLSLTARADDPIVPEDAKLELVFDKGLVLTEGVAVAPDGMVYFSDITFSHVSLKEKGKIEAGHIWKFDPKTKKATIFRSPSSRCRLSTASTPTARSSASSPTRASATAWPSRRTRSRSTSSATTTATPASAGCPTRRLPSRGAWRYWPTISLRTARPSSAR